MSDEPTQPMDPMFIPPHPSWGWTYEVDLSRLAGANIYRDNKGTLVVCVNAIWYDYDPERQMYMVNGDWITLNGD